MVAVAWKRQQYKTSTLTASVSAGLDERYYLMDSRPAMWSGSHRLRLIAVDRQSRCLASGCSHASCHILTKRHTASNAARQGAGVFPRRCGGGGGEVAIA